MALISQFLSYFCPSPIISSPCPTLFLARNRETRYNTECQTNERIFVVRLSKLRRILIFANAKDTDITDFLVFHGMKDYHDEEKEHKGVTRIYPSILIFVN